MPSSRGNPQGPSDRSRDFQVFLRALVCSLLLVGVSAYAGNTSHTRSSGSAHAPAPTAAPAPAPPPPPPKGVVAASKPAPVPLPVGEALPASASAMLNLDGSSLDAGSSGPIGPTIVHNGWRTISVLQLGDSHTAADYFTGVLRDHLQNEYGDAGTGYIPPGRPHGGVRLARLAISTSAHWTYGALRTTSDVSTYFLSGFTASAALAGEALTWTATGGRTDRFRTLEIEALTGPDQGSFDVVLDDQLLGHWDLRRPTVRRVVLRTRASAQAIPFGKLVLTTTSDSPVTIGGLGLYDDGPGVVLSEAGLPSATVNAFDKLDEPTFEAELERMRPDVVVVAFGTNEGFDDNLDLQDYGHRYSRVIGRIRAALPDVRIALIGPPDGERLPASCRRYASSATCGKPPTRNSKGKLVYGCQWARPPKLDATRDVIATLAQSLSLAYWNWATINPGSCGAHDLATGTPKLMASDHVHFSAEGYKQSAEAFEAVLDPLVAEAEAGDHAVPNN